MKHAAVVAVVLAVLLAAGAGYAEFRAAAAMRVVTPEKMLPLSGGVGTGHPATGKVGELAVRALVMEQGETRVALVSGDFLGFPAVLGNKVRAQVKGIPAANVIIGATHCHSAPDMYGFFGGGDVAYMDYVCGRMAEAINEAVGALQPAVAKIACAPAKGKIAYNYYAPQLYDPRMSVLQILTPDEKPLATLVNYATHPEIIGSGQGIICPDFVQPLCDRIAEKGGGAGIFMNGAQGGMVTADCRGPNGDIQTWEECVRIGNLMADEGLRIVENAPVFKNPDLACFATTVTFKVESPALLAALQSSPLAAGQSTDTVSTQVNLVNIGDSQILTIPGEALPNIGYYLKRNMYGRCNFLFGLTNDAFGYMMTKEDWYSFQRYEYISATCLGEHTADHYVDEALKFVNASPRPKAE